MSTQNSSGGKNLSAFLLIAVGLVLVGASLFYYFGSSDDAVLDIAEADQIEAPIAEEISDVVIDVRRALAPRTLGAIDAPNKITEFSSLSCGHCADFHAKTMPEIKARHIDTGNVRVVFTEFPLNIQALEATMLARCLPADKYVEFTEMLFANQESWAFREDHAKVLTRYANDYGMDKATAQACLDSTELRDGLIARVEAAQTQWDIKSTPSFVVNNKEVLRGGVAIDFFEAAFKSTTE